MKNLNIKPKKTKLKETVQPVKEAVEKIVSDMGIGFRVVQMRTAQV